MNKTAEALIEALVEADKHLDLQGFNPSTSPIRMKIKAAIREALAEPVKLSNSDNFTNLDNSTNNVINQKSVALNIAAQCRATASDAIAANIIVDAGSGTLRELLLDAAQALENAAPVQPVKQEPVAVVKKSLTTELLADALTSILKMDVKGYELQERLQFSPAGRQLLEKANNALSAPLQPVKQEPVAWAYIDADGSFMDALDRQHGAYQTPLYAAPPKREWQGLTDADFAGLTIQQIFAAKFAEAKLKEKNG